MPAKNFFHFLVLGFKGVATCLKNINRQALDEAREVVVRDMHIKVCATNVRYLL